MSLNPKSQSAETLYAPLSLTLSPSVNVLVYKNSLTESNHLFAF